MKIYENDSHSFVYVGERPYVCDQCDRTFTQTAALSRHIKIVHQEIRPYSCHLCLMSFKMSKTLKSHLTTHKQADQQTTSRKKQWPFFYLNIIHFLNSKFIETMTAHCMRTISTVVCGMRFEQKSCVTCFTQM